MNQSIGDAPKPGDIFYTVNGEGHEARLYVLQAEQEDKLVHYRGTDHVNALDFGNPKSPHYVVARTDVLDFATAKQRLIVERRKALAEAEALQPIHADGKITT